MKKMVAMIKRLIGMNLSIFALHNKQTTTRSTQRSTGPVFLKDLEWSELKNKDINAPGFR